MNNESKSLENELKSLRNRVARLEATALLSREGLAVFDEEGQLVEANGSARGLLGLSPIPDDNQNERFLITWQDSGGRNLEWDDGPIGRVLNGKIVEGMVFRSLLSEYDLELRAKRVKDGENNCVAVVMRRHYGAGQTRIRLESDTAKLFQNLSEHSPFPMILTTTKGEVRYINPAGESMIGYTSEEAVDQDMHVGKHTPEQEREKDIRAFEQIMKQGYCDAYEKEFYDLEGKQHSSILSGVLIDEEEPLVAMMGMETTEWHHAEETSKTNLQMMRMIFDNAREGMFLLKEDGKIFRANRKARELFSLTPEQETIYEPEGKMAYDMFDMNGDLIKGDQIPLTRIMNGEKPTDEIITLRYRDSGREWVADYSGLPVRNESGEITMAFITVRDITHQFMADEALRKSEERFRKIMESGPFGFALSSSDGRILYANANMEHMAGYTAMEMRSEGFHWNVTTAPDYEDLHEEFERQLYAYGYTKPVETVFVQQDGRRFPVLLSGTLLDDDEYGNQLSAVITVDMSQVMDAREKLFRRESQINAIFEQVTAGIGLIEGEQLLLGNKKFFELVACDAGDRTGMNIDEQIKLGEGVEMEALLREALDSINAVDYEGPLFCCEDNMRWVQMSVSSSDVRRGQCIVVIVDISERHRAEESLIWQRRQAELRERRLQKIMDLLPVGVAIMDKNRVLQQANHRLGEIWELAVKDIVPVRTVALPLHQLFVSQTGEVFDSSKHGVDYVTRTGKAVERLRLDLVLSKSRRKSLLAYFVPLFDADGEIVDIINITIDMTEQQEALEEIRRLNLNLEDRIAERTASLMEQRHLLRNLASELTIAEQRERRRFATELHDYLPQIIVACKMKTVRIGDLIRSDRALEILSEVDKALDQALDYSRTLVADLSPTVLYEFGLTAGFPQLSEQMERRGLAVSFVEEGEEQGLSDDLAILIYQTIRELLVNIVKHARTDRAEVRVIWGQDALYVEVADEGRGFVVADAEPGGAANPGFGLYSIRERVTALGGTMGIDSQPGGGTRVEISVPVQADVPQHYRPYRGFIEDEGK